MYSTMSDTEFKTTEARLRRLAQRKGLALRKSRSRTPEAYEYGGFLIVDPFTNGCVASGYCTIEQVEDILRDW